MLKGGQTCEDHATGKKSKLSAGRTRSYLIEKNDKLRRMTRKASQLMVRQNNSLDLLAFKKAVTLQLCELHYLPSF
jgi:hypothetical protein